GGVTGMRSADPVIWAGVVADPDSVVVTVAGHDATSGATGSVKVTAFGAYPGKGRGTKGMRCHRFLKGETALVQAWAGARPAVACSPKGRPVELPEVDSRRDGSGTSVAASILAISTRCWSHPTASDPGAAEKNDAMGAQPRSTADSTISTDGPINSDSPSSLGSDGATPGPGRETEQPDLFDE
ncbi:MAG: DNA topoisomerase IV, partial [Cutibacterium granulosum]|nr:DNA topoisomerase IV [Cutibacterium granulosum]